MKEVDKEEEKSVRKVKSEERRQNEGTDESKVGRKEKTERKRLR